MEITRENWKEVLTPVKTSELDEVLQDIDPRIWEDPQRTEYGRLEDKGALSKIDSWKTKYENPRILEIGCSEGFTTREIRERFPDAEVYGVDIINDFVSRRGHVQASGLNLPFDNASCDLAIAPHSLGLIEYKNIATRAGSEKAKNSRFFEENFVKLDREAKSSFSANARFEGGKAYNELYVEQVLDEAERVMTENGIFALIDGKNHIAAEKVPQGWDLLDKKEEDERYAIWEDQMNQYKALARKYEWRTGALTPEFASVAESG